MDKSMVLVFDRALTSIYRQAMNHTIDPAAESHKKLSRYYISNQMPNFPGPHNRKKLISTTPILHTTSPRTNHATNITSPHTHTHTKAHINEKNHRLPTYTPSP